MLSHVEESSQNNISQNSISDRKRKRATPHDHYSKKVIFSEISEIPETEEFPNMLPNSSGEHYLNEPDFPESEPEVVTIEFEPNRHRVLTRYVLARTFLADLVDVRLLVGTC